MRDPLIITDDEFDDLLIEIIKEEPGVLMGIPGVYEILAEHFNNEVLDRWETERLMKRGNE